MLKYDDVFIRWLIFLWLGVGLFVMGSCVVCAWCCCYVLCGCMNGASPVGFVLSLFYLCVFQMNPVCVECMVTSDRGLLFVYLFVTKVTDPNDWSEG